MEEIIHYDPFTLCSDFRFIRVLCPEGAFYDLVPKWRSRAHVFELKRNYPSAVTVFRAHVPPCLFRDFTELNGPKIYRVACWRQGTAFYLPMTEEEQAILASVADPACIPCPTGER